MTPTNARCRPIRIAPRWLGLLAAVCFAAARARALPEPPEHNRADLRAAPPRPPADERVDALGRLLFRTIVEDRPELALPVFFPRDAFLLVKAMKDPGRYWDQLHARFESDVHALHRQLAEPQRAEYDRLELAARGGWVRVGEEGNRLPYWASRHSVLHYHAGTSKQRFEVRVLITWDDRWYLIHLSEFRKRIAVPATDD